ncbi:YciI family protein [Terracoccus sp. 273MFTsu3.1]|uniref:YciI family protein n=1 Tax=Terracoccus sp. 273MFTsu3.1 TaxID=1172188 RepID=UPI00048C377E|nr:YciI family protein [Terracoccus sp. 273MFTsu3.1]
MRFMLMMHVGQDDGREVLEWAQEDIAAMIEFQRAFDRELEENGEMVFNAGLAWPDQARIVTYTDGTPAVSDGPFPPGREFLIGFWVVECDSEERAYAIAAKASSSPGPGGAPTGVPIEVRPLAGPPPVDA